jgi:hypothetical protein
MLLGDNAGCWSLILRSIRFHCAGVWILTGRPVYGSTSAYSIPAFRNVTVACLGCPCCLEETLNVA